MNDEPGIDLSTPPLELGEREQQVMDLLTSKPWFVTSMERKAGPMQEIRGMGGPPEFIYTGPGEITVTITIPS